MPKLTLNSAFIIGAALLAAPVYAAVSDSDANGFTTKLELNIAAPPQDVYDRLVHNVGDWWDPAHTYSRDAHNLSIDDKAMGCFCEKLPSGGGVRHLEVVNADPGKRLVLSGGMGPLQSMAATGSMSIQLSPSAGGTKLAVQYAVVGYAPHGMSSLAGPVDSVVTELFSRLKNFVETGKAENEKAAPQ